MIRNKRTQNQNRNATRNWPYHRRNSNVDKQLLREEVTTIDIPSAHVHLFGLIFVCCFEFVCLCNFQDQKIGEKKMVIATTDARDLLQLNEYLGQRKMHWSFQLIESSGPPHHPVFTMRLSIFNHDSAYQK